MSTGKRRTVVIMLLLLVVGASPILLSMLWKLTTGYYAYERFVRMYLLPAGHPEVVRVDSESPLFTEYAPSPEPVEGRRFRYLWNRCSFRESFDDLPPKFFQGNDLARLLEDTSLSDLEKADRIFTTPPPREYLRDVTLFPHFPPRRDYQSIARRQAVCNMLASGGDLTRIDAPNAVAWLARGGTGEVADVRLFGKGDGGFLGRLYIIGAKDVPPEDLLLRRPPQPGRSR